MTSQHSGVAASFTAISSPTSLVADSSAASDNGDSDMGETYTSPLSPSQFKKKKRTSKRSRLSEKANYYMLAANSFIIYGWWDIVEPQPYSIWLASCLGHAALCTPCNTILQYDIAQIQCNTVYRAVQQIPKQYSAVWGRKNIVYGILHYLLHWTRVLQRAGNVSGPSHAVDNCGSRFCYPLGQSHEIS